MQVERFDSHAPWFSSRCPIAQSLLEEARTPRSSPLSPIARAMCDDLLDSDMLDLDVDSEISILDDLVGGDELHPLHLCRCHFKEHDAEYCSTSGSVVSPKRLTWQVLNVALPVFE